MWMYRHPLSVSTINFILHSSSFLPTLSMVSVSLFIKVQENWIEALQIPVQEAFAFSTRPLKWLRFLGWCIYGQPGHLAATPGGTQINDNLADFLPRYYYVSTFSPCFIDPFALHKRTSNGSASTGGRSFRANIVARDGVCIITGARALDCKACHLIPHVKGDSYIRNFMEYRDITGQDRVSEIKDVRNGVLLYGGLHRAFGAGEFAFLLTPNLYLNPSDVPINAEYRQDPIDDSRPRLTIQHIHTPPGSFIRRIAPHNKDASLDLSPDAPSPPILHLIYTCAILARYGPHQLSLGSWEDYYLDGRYSPGPEEDDEDSQRGDEDVEDTRYPGKNEEDVSSATAAEELDTRTFAAYQSTGHARRRQEASIQTHRTTDRASTKTASNLTSRQKDRSFDAAERPHVPHAGRPDIFAVMDRFMAPYTREGAAPPPLPNLERIQHWREQVEEEPL